jgi:predicted regulator of Ras-like GTPase activity (Roadblock/LC7/MglB family)
MPVLREILARLLAIPGVRAAVLVGREGLPIEMAGRGDQRFLESLGAHGASALGVTEALGHELSGGRSIAALLEYEDALVSVDPLGDYAALVTLCESAASLSSVRQLVYASRDEVLRQLDLR